MVNDQLSVLGIGSRFIVIDTLTVIRKLDLFADIEVGTILNTFSNLTDIVITKTIQKHYTVVSNVRLVYWSNKHTRIINGQILFAERR